MLSGLMASAPGQSFRRVRTCAGSECHRKRRLAFFLKADRERFAQCLFRELSQNHEIQVRIHDSPGHFRMGKCVCQRLIEIFPASGIKRIPVRECGGMRQKHFQRNALHPCLQIRMCSRIFEKRTDVPLAANTASRSSLAFDVLIVPDLTSVFLRGSWYQEKTAALSRRSIAQETQSINMAACVFSGLERALQSRDGRPWRPFSGPDMRKDEGPFSRRPSSFFVFVVMIRSRQNSRNSDGASRSHAPATILRMLSQSAHL